MRIYSLPFNVCLLLDGCAGECFIEYDPHCAGDDKINASRTGRICRRLAVFLQKTWVCIELSLGGCCWEQHADSRSTVQRGKSVGGGRDFYSFLHYIDFPLNK